MPNAKAKTGQREKASSLNDLLKKFGAMGISHVDKIEKVQRNPTAILSLDLLLKGGLPIGRTVLHYGSEGSGKSTTWLLIAREQIRRGNPVLWLDVERTIEKEYMELLGIDVEDAQAKRLLDVIKVQTSEQGIDALIMALELKHYKLIVVDTWAKLVPGVEAGASVSKDQMGVASRLNSRATRVWGKALDESGATLVILNQERTDLGAYGAPSVSSGGKGLMKHEPSIILFSQRNSNEYHGGQPTKLIFNYTIKKSKVFPFAPISSVKDYHQFHIKCESGIYEIDHPYELYAAALDLQLLQDKSGAVWQRNVAFFEGEPLGNGEKQVQEFFEKDSPLKQAIQEAVNLAIAEGRNVYQGTPTEVHDDPDGDSGSDDEGGETESD